MSSSYIGLDRDIELTYMKSQKYRFKKIIDSIPRFHKPIKILDIGTTPFTIFIKEFYPHYEVSTLDRTNLMENRCKAKGIQFRICDLDEQSVPFEDDYFDIVIFTDVLEHIFAPPIEVMREIGRIMRVGGKLIFSVPNIAKLHQRIKLLFGVTPLPNPDDQMRKSWVHGHGHIHEYTMREIVNLLKDCNFKISNKKFLQPAISDPFNNSNKVVILPLIQSVYLAVTFLIPSFRSAIYIECYK